MDIVDELYDSYAASILTNRAAREIEALRADIESYIKITADQANEIERLHAALIRLRDCDWVISIGDRMDAVRDIARKALDEH